MLSLSRPAVRRGASIAVFAAMTLLVSAPFASASPPPFGLEAFSSFPAAGPAGEHDTQAGDHPYELTTTIALNSVERIGPEGSFGLTSVEDLKDVVVDLPVGFLGSALAAPTCTFAQLSSAQLVSEAHCPPDTQVGHIYTAPQGLASVNGPIYNMVPERGVAAEFGFVDDINVPHVMYASLVPAPAPTPAGYVYVLRVTSPGIAQIALTSIEVNFFGDPAVRDGTGNTPVALFTNPSDCSAGPLTTTIFVDSWQTPGASNADGTPNLEDPAWKQAQSSALAVTGCNQLQFKPEIAVQPDNKRADSPTGLEVDLKVPQSEDPSTLATPPLRTAVVTLPAGMSISPSSAGGLGACSQAQIALGSPDAPSCPKSSKIGTVELATPLLTPLLGKPLEGSVYLATQNENPFHSLLALYIVVDDPATGIVVKLPGRVDLNPTTGQITTTFAEDPQLPFSELKLRFKQGARAPLATPGACGTYTTTSSLTPWSAPDSGPPATPSDPFEVTAGPGGTPCGPQGFSPSFTAGTTSNQAGAFSPLTVTLSRNDGEQRLGSVSTRMPAGLEAMLSGVPLCGEAQANAGTCPAASRIGHVTVTAGAGPEPLLIPQAGKPQDPVYLTGPYKGAPFGLSIVVPAEAGPFNLDENGRPVVVRAAISVDPKTAQVTVSSDPMPSILQGIPLDVRTVNITIDREGFMFNPTNCTPMTVGGTIASTQGATANVSSRFQAANCANLPFKPKFQVSTSAKHSRKNGASLHVVVQSGAGQANIGSVKVNLPKQLPSRLSTLKQACLEKVFNTNPGACPAGSKVGGATAYTPVLPVALTGPAYFVSHGGAKFPELVVVLQGDGVTVDLAGETFINEKTGITSSTFRSVPDVPITRFDLVLPTGAHSALAGNGSFCNGAMHMPTQIKGQNGAVVKQSTSIEVQGCPKTKKAKAKPKKKK